MPMRVHLMKRFVTAIIVSGVSLFAQQSAPASSFTLKEDFSGKVYQIGDVITVEWDATGDSIRGAVVSLSTDGATWVELNPDGVIKPGDPEWGKVVWTIPEKAFADGVGFVSVVGDSVRLRVIDNRQPQFVTYSGMFSIEGDVSVRSVFPLSLKAADLKISLTSNGLIIGNAFGAVAQVSVLDLSGKKIGRFQLNPEINSRLQFDRELPGGTYLIHLESVTEEQRFSETVVKSIQN